MGRHFTNTRFGSTMFYRLGGDVISAGGIGQISDGIATFFSSGKSVTMSFWILSKVNMMGLKI